MTYRQHVAQQDRRSRERTVAERLEAIPLTQRAEEAEAQITVIVERAQRNNKLPMVVYTPERIVQDTGNE